MSLAALKERFVLTYVYVYETTETMELEEATS